MGQDTARRRRCRLRCHKRLDLAGFFLLAKRPGRPGWRLGVSGANRSRLVPSRCLRLWLHRDSIVVSSGACRRWYCAGQCAVGADFQWRREMLQIVDEFLPKAMQPVVFRALLLFTCSPVMRSFTTACACPVVRRRPTNAQEAENGYAADHQHYSPLTLSPAQRLLLVALGELVCERSVRAQPGSRKA